ncbi:MAG: HlyD family efflux transporter periplasmic adaptor subunit [Planctomycetota bacterium]
MNRLTVSRESTDHSEEPTVASIGALGRLEPASRIRRVAPWTESRSAAIIQMHVKEQQYVEAGQVLATFDNHDRLVAGVDVARANVETAQANLKRNLAGADPNSIKAKCAELDAAKSRWQMLMAKHARSKRLQFSKAVSAEEYDRAKWELEDASLSVERLTAELLALRTVREVDTDLLKAEVQAAEAELVRRKKQLCASQVLAPINGVVLRIHAREGEAVGVEGILELADTSVMQAVAEVFEADAGRIQVGMPAKMTIVSSGYQFTGAVVSLGSVVGRQATLSIDPVRNVDSRVVEVRIAIEPSSVARLARLSNARVEVVIEPTSKARFAVDGLHQRGHAGGRG